jgi:amino acid permease
MGWVIFFILFGSLTLGGYIWFIPYINDQTFIIHYIGIGLTIVCYILAFIIWEYNTATISKYLQKKHGECQTVNTYAYPRKYHYRKPWKTGNKQRDKYEYLYFKGG